MISKNMVERLLADFSDSNIALFKCSVPSFLDSEGPNLSEKEVETHGLVAEMKKGIIPEDFALITIDMERRLPMDSIDLITYTPDSGNGSEENTFTYNIKVLANAFHIPTIAPEIVGDMKKQKTMTNTESRLANRLGKYVFDEDDISGKRVLLIDDVLKTGATALAIVKDLQDKGAEVFFYCIANVSLNKD